MENVIVVERRILKKCKDEVLKKQLDRCASISMRGGRGSGWIYTLESISNDKNEGVNIIRAKIRFKTTSNRESLSGKWDSIVRRFAECGCSGSMAENPWIVVEPKGYEKVIGTESKLSIAKQKENEEKVLGEINLVPGNHFERIYGRDAHIRRLMSVLRLAQRTGWTKRKNSLLDGPPGCGKSEIMMSTAQMLGKEGEAWRWFDATSMTKAGAIEEIMNSQVVAPVLFIEEIEKCEEASLRWLLGVMDTRGEIRRLNYRVGNQARNVRMVVIASANDVPLLKRVMSGALYSRFQNKIYCPPPNREIMNRILKREIVEIDGKEEWIEPTLQFGYDKWGIIDPREIINIMSVGGDDLLAGIYQKDHEHTMHPQEKHDLIKAKKRREIRANKLRQLESNLTTK